MVTLTGGDALERKFSEIAKRLGKSATLRVGFLEGAKYPDGTQVAMVAAVQNFGNSRGIPPRPFFTNMIAEKSPAWGDQFMRVLVAADYNVELALERMGEGIANQIRQAIRDTNSPPLAQSTIDAKGFDKPLIDTGHMLNSVGVEVTVAP